MWEVVAGCRPGRPGRRGPGDRAGPQGESLPSSAGVGGAQCAGSLLQAQGRFASQATATNRPPLTSEPLRPSGRSRGQADGLPLVGCRTANPATDSPVGRRSLCQESVDGPDHIGLRCGIDRYGHY